MDERGENAVGLASAMLVLGLASCLLLASCGNPLGTPRARAGRCSVGIVGDSLLVGARDLGDLKARLYDDVCSITAIDGKVGRPSSAGASIVENWASSGSLPAILVVELGTNDCSASVFEQNARRILKAAGSERPIVWVNTWRAGCDTAINGVLDRLRYEGRSRSDGGRLWTVDDHDWITAHRQYLGGDGIHLTAAGYRAYAQRMVDALGIRRR